MREHLAAFFPDYGVDAVVNGIGEPIRIFFERPALSAFDTVATTAPTATGESADLAYVQAGDTLAIAGEHWRVSAPPEPDGTGITHLRLERLP